MIPLAVASILLSIFIASIIAIGSPSFTSSLSATNTFTIFPGIFAPTSYGSSSAANTTDCPATATPASLSNTLMFDLLPFTSKSTSLNPSTSGAFISMSFTVSSFPSAIFISDTSPSFIPWKNTSLPTYLKLPSVFMDLI